MNPAPQVWLGSDGILRIAYPRDFHLSLDAMHRVYQQHLKITTEKLPTLVYAESVASADHDAQQFASSDEAVSLVSIMAIVVKSFFTRALADIFMKYHRPPYPVRVFTREEDALDWLKKNTLPTGRQYPESLG